MIGMNKANTTNLATKLVVAAFKLTMRDPNRDARTQRANPQIYTIPQIRTKLDLASVVNSVLEATVVM